MLMCCSETSASVQWVATRMVCTPRLVRHLQVIDGADARQQQGRHLGLLHQRDHGAQVFLVGVRRKAVVDRGAAQAVAVGHFDQRHAGRVQAAGDGYHLLQRHLVALGVHAVAQGHVVDGDFLACEIHGVSLRFKRRRAASVQCAGQDFFGEHLGGARGGGGHDVEVAGVLGQVVAQALDLQVDRDALAVEHRAVDQACSRARTSALRRSSAWTEAVIAPGPALLGQAVHGVAHDQRRLGRVDDDDGLASLGAADLFDRTGGGAGELVDVLAGAGADRAAGHGGDDLAIGHRLHAATRPPPSGSWPGRRR